MSKAKNRFGKHITILCVLVSLLFMSMEPLYAQNATLLFKDGKTAYRNNNFKDAVRKFKYSIDVSKKNRVSAEQYYWLAKASTADSILNYYRIIELLNTAIALDPEYPEAYFLRAQVRSFIIGENQAVIDDFEKAAQYADERDLNDIVLHSVSLAFSGDREQIIRNLKAIIDGGKGPNNKAIILECQFALAAIYQQENELNQALFRLNMAFFKGYEPDDILFLYFYNLVGSEQFIKIMERNDVYPGLYRVSNLSEIKKIRELGEFGYNRNKVIKRYVENKINIWQKKGKFEKTVDYKKRVTKQLREQKIAYYTQAAIDSIGYSMLKLDKVTNEYDADNETFKIIFPGFNPIYINIPVNDARVFDRNFSMIEFAHTKFVLLDDFTIEISHIELTDVVLGKTYVYNIGDNTPFYDNEFVFNFDEIQVPLDKVSGKSSGIKPKSNTIVINVGKSDVDANIPVTNKKSDLTLALIIGNEDYSRFQTGLNTESNVEFARRDAEIFSEYANKTLGIPKENIILLKDATSVQMQREIERIAELANAYQGEANIIFYYAGHGFPDEQTKESYIMPVDVSGADVKHGVKLNDLYKTLTKYPTKKVIVVLDACFSGGGRNQGLLAARGVRIKPKQNAITGNLVVLTSSTGDQSSLPYNNKQHGMFTYFMLKKLKETGGDVSMEELSNYISKEVSISSLKINSKKQNPTTLISPDAESLWMDWKLN